MKVAETIADAHALRETLPGPVGFVPTMGALHEGHLSLVRSARAENGSVVVSIFVNPTQFSPSEDFASYPRDLKRDLSLLESESVDLVFTPPTDELYPEGYSTWVTVESLTRRLEGASRPTHFRGVATIVTKLFNIIRPDRAYFGQKDAQQALVIRRMIADLNLPIELRICPTVREEDGLALSSRNAYLSEKERRAAVVLYRGLELAERMFFEGERDADRIRRAIRELISSEPLAEIDYVSVADIETLAELKKLDRPALVSLAVRFSRTRLIDNTILPPGHEL